MSPGLDWDGLLWETREWLDLDEDDPVPREELVATAEANGYSDREIREALADTDALEATDASLDYVVEREAPPETAKPDESGDEDAGISTETPTPEAGDPAEDGDLEERAHAAFADAIKFYHNQIDTELPVEYADTARDYYENVRGWSTDTVEDKLLGYAPGDCRDELIAHLHRRGHERDAIQACGLFYEDDLYPHFNGRFVLPYFDESGDPTYAISRSIDEDDGGHPDDHHGDQKYTKAIKGQDYSVIDEPIYGTDTLDENTDRLLVAGGIADAITLHEAGYACISPVTTVRFKSKHEPVVVDLVERYDLDGVYMLNDAERPSTDKMEMEEGEEAEAIGEALTIKQYGEGERGAFGNAEFLLDEGVDPYLVRLPGGDDNLRKLDPDDYVKEGWGSVDTLLGSARHAEYHRGYADWNSHRRERDVEEAIQTGDRKNSRSSGDGTELYDLEFTDVSGMSLGDRQNNPLGHHGGSEGYFVCAEKKGVVHGYDHKYNVAYNAVSFLLCDAGERRADDPNGRLSDREVFVAWKHAKANNHLPDDDPVPYRGLLGIAVDEGLLDRDDLVVRDADTGDVVDDPDEYDGDTYEAFPPGAYAEALEHVRDEHGVDPGREVPAYDDGDSEEGEEEADTGRELLTLDVVVEPANALAAAAAVEPDDLDEPLPELEREAVDDVAIAVALADGMIDAPEEFPDDGRYTEAYYRARDHYGAPLPKYLDNSTLEERTDLIFAALERVEPKHVLDGCRSDVTVEDPSGEAIAKLNPTWEDSESGERILAGYGRGFYCVEHDVSFSPIVLAALENDLVFTEGEYPRGEAFKQAYRILREEYGAPLPKWRATVLEHVAVLPPAARVLGESSADRSLDDARKQTEALLREAVDVRDRAQLLTNLPGTGKTFGAALIAADTPILYLVQRNELKQQMEDYAAEIRDRDDLDGEPTVAHLPILAAEPFDDAAIGSGVEAVREHGFDLLADREALLERADLPEDDPEDDDADDEVDLDRPTCPVADGEHGEAWAFAVQVARRLKLAPAVIHQYDTALFGEELPCQHDGDCPYSLGWEAVRNPDDCPDILVGSPGHAHVDSATTYFDRGADGDRVERSRAVVVDEFLGESYLDTYGDRYLDHATWLAEALAGVETREDLAEAGLDADTWVNLWLDGDGEEYADAADAIDRLEDGRQLCEARRAAERLLEDGAVDTNATPSASLDGAAEALADLRDGAPTDGDLAAARDRLARVHDDVEAEADRAYATEGGEEAGRLYALAEALDDVVAPLSAALEATDTDDLPAAVEAAADALPVGGDLRALLDDAVDALRGEDAPEGLLDAAVSALRGGRDGCRDLAIYADDGYAHPDAWALLAGAIARDTAVAETETFAFDGDEGGTFKHLKTNRATVVADKNHHGAVVLDHPAFTDITGDKCPVVGLDATGRPKLWKIALGRDVERRDIHDSDAERRGFLRANGYAVVQTTNDPLPYHGDPEGKNFGEDLELVKTVAEEYTGTGPGAIDDKNPAVISTKKVVDHLEDDLDAHADAVVNYENMKGSDALGDHQVAAILGSCHFSDTEPEKWALLAGESAGRGDTRGDTLDYGSDVANAYLRYMREDTTMQAILRAGRNDDDTVIFAHTAALRDDLPTVDEGVVLSAHSKGTLAVAEAAKEYRTEPFTVRDLVDAIADDDRAVGRRQVQNIVADLRESGYLRVLEEGGHGVDAEYELEEEPGLADVELPEPPDGAADSAAAPDENTRIEELYTWNFVRSDADGGGDGVVPPTRPTIPAADTADALADGVEPPG